MGFGPVTAHHLHSDARRTRPRQKRQDRLRTGTTTWGGGRGLTTAEANRTEGNQRRGTRFTFGVSAAACLTFNPP